MKPWRNAAIRAKPGLMLFQNPDDPFFRDP